MLVVYSNILHPLASILLSHPTFSCYYPHSTLLQTPDRNLRHFSPNLLRFLTFDMLINSIDHLQDGLKLGLEGTVEKHSSILGRDAIWLRKQRVASLPKYLCIQFMRFFWKPTPDR